MPRMMLVPFLLAGLACASPKPVAPLAASPITPGPGEQVAVTHSYVIVDSSSSVDDVFPTEKALVQSLVSAQPDGDYEAGSVAFGGFERQEQPLARFDRARLTSAAADLEHLKESTPLDRVLNEVGAELEGKSGQAAVIVFSDGEPTDPGGHPIEEQQVLDAAANLVSGFQGEVCIHTVHTGEDAEGAAFMRRLSDVTGCGTTRSADGLLNVASIQGLARDVYIEAAPAVAAAPRGTGDEDGDGVLDPQDECPGTPSGVNVDPRGCWVLGVRFAFDSAEIQPQYYEELNRVANRLKEVGPDVTVRVDGHTDSVGSAAYNEGLSERRARAVKDYLVQQGVPESQLRVEGFGAAQPAYPNDTEQGRAGNRRTELSRL